MVWAIASIMETLHLTVSVGKQWHDNKSAFRPRANQSSWEKRSAERKALAAVKAKEKEMKEEKAAEKQVRSVVLCTQPSTDTTIAASRCD